MKKIYIASLSVVLSLMGIVFLAAPATYLGTLGLQIGDPSALNMIRSFGGFYLGFAALLVFLARRNPVAELAVAAAVLAMAGLLAGRSVSLFADGRPDRSLLASAAVELAFGIWGIVILVKRHAAKP
jgi:hypothetical protein